jgi:hypothetical protein
VIDLDNNGSLVYSSFFFCTSVGGHIFSYNFIEATSIGFPLGKKEMRFHLLEDELHGCIQL